MSARGGGRNARPRGVYVPRHRRKQMQKSQVVVEESKSAGKPRKPAAVAPNQPLQVQSVGRSLDKLSISGAANTVQPTSVTDQKSAPIVSTVDIVDRVARASQELQQAKEVSPQPVPDPPQSKAAPSTSSATTLPWFLKEDDATSMQHVVEVYDFPLSMKEYHVSQVLGSLGDSLIGVQLLFPGRAVAVFRNEQAARAALRVKHAFFKLRSYSESSERVKQSIDPESLPKAQRPKKDVSAAKRLIAGALNIRMARTGPTRSSAEIAAIRAKEKKERAERRARTKAGLPPKPKTPEKDNSAWDSD